MATQPHYATIGYHLCPTDEGMVLVYGPASHLYCFSQDAEGYWRCARSDGLAPLWACSNTDFQTHVITGRLLWLCQGWDQE